MYVEAIPNRASPPAILLRESFRERGKVKKRTLANLSDWPAAKVDALRKLLRDELPRAAGGDFEIVRSRPHGHVAAVLGTLRHVQLEPLLAKSRSHERDLVVAMIAARIVDPLSKLATARGLGDATAFSSLGELLDVSDADEDEPYQAMDWLLPRQERVEAALAKRHLEEGTLALYDATTTYFEGRHCPLARLGKPKDGKRGKLQIVIGLLCTKSGCPVAVEVFPGNTADPKTLSPQIAKLRERFHLERIVWVGDRGRITQARIRQDLRSVEGLDWITALRAPSIRKLLESGALQLSLFDQRDLGEINHPDWPGERLIVCRNPLLAEERARKRDELLEATEKELKQIQARTRGTKRKLSGKAQIGIAVGRVINCYKVAKHFQLEIGEDSFSFERRVEKIAAESSLDGIYVVRTSVPHEVLSSQEAVRAYKGLSVVERAFRSLKTMDLKVRPIHHRLEQRVRAHVFLCMLAYYVEWHMRQALAPLLFEDHDKAAAARARTSVVAPAQRSERALTKILTKQTEQGFPAHSFHTLLKDLATLTKNKVRVGIAGAPLLDLLATPTPLQRRAFELLQVKVAL